MKILALAAESFHANIEPLDFSKQDGDYLMWGWMRSNVGIFGMER